MEKRLRVQILTNNEIDKEAWNDNLKISLNSDIFQTSYYADFLGEYYDLKVYYCYVFDSDIPVAQLMFFEDDEFRRYYFERPWSNCIKKAVRKFFSVFIWWHGPVIHVIDRNEEIDKLLFCELRLFAKQRNAYRIKYILPYNHGKHLQYDNKSGMETVLLNLEVEKDELWRQLKHSTRKNIKKVQKYGLEIFRAEMEKEFVSYYNIVRESRSRNGLHFFSDRNLKLWWKHLKRNNCIELFLARINNLIVGGLGILYFNGHIYEMSSNMNNYCNENRLPVGELLRWEVILWAKSQAFKFYDLAGINTISESLKDKNICRFKLKFGGTVYKGFNYNIEIGQLRCSIEKKFHF